MYSFDTHLFAKEVLIIKLHTVYVLSCALLLVPHAASKSVLGKGCSLPMGRASLLKREQVAVAGVLCQSQQRSCYWVRG
jgi:hypothetical protein